MLRKIIVGHDTHAGGGDALALGRALAQASDAQLVVAGIFPVGKLPHGFEARWREEEESVAKEIQEIADGAGATPEAFPASSPARGLSELAEEINADLIIVGSSRHSKLGQILAGNVGLGVLHGAPCAVAVAPRGYAERAPESLDSIVLGYDGSAEANVALEVASGLAKGADAELRLVAVVDPPPIVYGKGGEAASGYPELEEAIEEQLREQLDGALAGLEGVGAEASLLNGDPAEKLVAAASSASLLCLGSRAYGPLRRVLLGGVSTQVMQAAHSPVLVCPRGVEVLAPAAAKAEVSG